MEGGWPGSHVIPGAIINNPFAHARWGSAGLNIFGAWVRATGGSPKDRFLRTVFKNSYITVFLLIGMFYVFFLGYASSDAACYSTIAIAIVVEAIVIYMAWVKCS